jgi:transcriptional regulator with PAS, ATPase and Fis domain
VGDRRLTRGATATVLPGVAIAIGGATLLLMEGAAPTFQRGAAPALEDPGDGVVVQIDDAVVADPAMRQLHRLVERVAAGTINVLFLGETGVGKEVFARRVHRASPRAARPLLCLNCAALSPALMESELFGHEKGSFTGAVAAKPGLLESAEGGTVFLDEVGELPQSVQVKLLRVLEERRVTRVGGLKPRDIDVRLVSATNRDLQAEIERGAFRSDLFFRLDGVSLRIPPLRERPSEIEPLALRFVAGASAQLGRPPSPITEEALAWLFAHSWPGNIRELRNTMERAVLLAAGAPIAVEHLRAGRPVTMAPPPPPPAALPDDLSLAGLRGEVEAKERERIVAALGRSGGNQKEAARLLGVSRRTLIERLEQYALPRPRKDRRQSG